ncbi:hypothetical protein [Legionella sainthelensi]|uniref:hypothetical protein n=1 Tax=Legionella sainthelensi TaxID=28087 RepID=UPI000E203B6D|nr:hypothetical protein [Legionella sainthelensi]
MERSFFKIVSFIALILPTLVFAATQGTLGSTSTGTVNVSITIPALVQITGLSDITLGSTSSFPATGNTTACIYSNVATPLGSYYVTATSQNTSGTDFRVKDSGTDYIVYSAFWNNTSAAAQTTALTSGTKTAQQTGGSAVSLTCGGSSNANFNISFSASQVQGAPAATYTDVVTLLITPT